MDGTLNLSRDNALLTWSGQCFIEISGNFQN